ncbi:14459_t:CDS:2 [Funneliformis geosporum]|uniref:3738_t:CDS:1 n=1 Tax=Funneliformis geosporum TaxID=1117311 RepID=A0A9W4SD95_9GLOM|nr:3738_t:CDS:2 [Funneliformis geosporum]CAI2171650.1 14459_t:CDS:2 [Funneliformis geosporum]
MENFSVLNVFTKLIFDSLKEDGFIFNPFPFGFMNFKEIKSFVEDAIFLNPLKASGLVKDEKKLFSITNEVDNDNMLQTKVIFDIKYQLFVSKENEKLKSFLRGFELARQVLGDRIKNFKFLVIIDDKKCLEGSNFLYKHLTITYGNEHVTSKSRTIFLNNNIISILREVTEIVLLL